MNIKGILKVISLPVFFASLCCLAPIILVLVGLSTVTFAASLTNLLDGTYRWLFDIVGIVTLIVSIVIYFRKQGVCTLDQAKRHRNEIMNKILIFAISASILYYLFFFVFLNLIGKSLHIWE